MSALWPRPVLLADLVPFAETRFPAVWRCRRSGEFVFQTLWPCANKFARPASTFMIVPSQTVFTDTTRRGFALGILGMWLRVAVFGTSGTASLFGLGRLLNHWPRDTVFTLEYARHFIVSDGRRFAAARRANVVGVLDHIEAVSVLAIAPCRTFERLARSAETDLPIIVQVSRWGSDRTANSGSKRKAGNWNRPGYRLLQLDFLLLLIAAVDADEAPVALPQHIVELTQSLVSSRLFLLGQREK